LGQFSFQNILQIHSESTGVITKSRFDDGKHLGFWEVIIESKKSGVIFLTAENE